MRLSTLSIATLCAAAAFSGCETEVIYTGAGGTGGEAGTSGTSSNTSTSTSSTSTSSGGGTLPGLPPPPEGAGPGDGPGITLAVSRFYLGDTDWSGVSSMSAWRQFGYNLDGQISDQDSTDLCQPAAGAPPSYVYPDGDNGIDNSWGKNILPIISGLSPDFSMELNARVLAGEFTFLVHIDGLGSQASYVDLAVRGYDGADLGAPPLFNGADLWPVKAESLVDPGDIGSSYTHFGSSYLNQNTLVALPLGEVRIEAVSGVLVVPWLLHHAVITMDLTPDHTAATRGIIAGIINTEKLIEDLKAVAGFIDPGLCVGTTMESIANQFRQTSDILEDGSQDPTKICDHMSVGIGFEAQIVQLGSITPPAPPMPDPCDDY